jgi:hypothetical protein
MAEGVKRLRAVISREVVQEPATPASSSPVSLVHCAAITVAAFSSLHMAVSFPPAFRGEVEGTLAPVALRKPRNAHASFCSSSER